ncbi:parasitic phase-specific protein PSP-1 [Aspergillus karnatakaensis]|uniref:RTA1 domain-containing protein n=1 Tax=Aspergillus karnatakaensis TaxID=1810916 RepID=UPI003CCD752A
MSLPDGLISFGPDANCTLDLCPLESSILQYQPSIPANSLFVAIFGLPLVVNLVQGIYYRTWGYMASLLAGCILEIAGYVCRLILHDNPFDFIGFLLQISDIIRVLCSSIRTLIHAVCITVAPVFFCAAIYVLLSQTILQINDQISRFKPRLLYWIFIPCDIISLILQAAGGGLSCIGTTQSDIQLGVDVSLASLIFQVVTLTVFNAAFLDYLYAVRRSKHNADAVVTPQMRRFLALMFLSILLILIRCVYRVVELHEGYFSHLFRDEPLFIALESAYVLSGMCAAAVTMNVGHPGRVFGKGSGKGDASGFEGVYPLLSVDSGSDRPRS